MDRRNFLAAASGAMLAAPAISSDSVAIRLGLTPVFLDNDAIVIERLREGLSAAMGGRVELFQRRTYQEITAALLSGSLDAAWICGYPFLQHRERMALLGVPVWRGKPLYQSYLIVSAGDTAQGLADLRGGHHAYSDPDSNSGYLVTASDIVRMGETPEIYFSRTTFTFGHRNVVRAVAGGLTRSGSVDGYVWEILATVEPELTARTKVIATSEWLGFPPFATRADRVGTPDLERFFEALRNLHLTPAGTEVLQLLHLDRVDAGNATLFDGIQLRMNDMAGSQ